VGEKGASVEVACSPLFTAGGPKKTGHLYWAWAENYSRAGIPRPKSIETRVREDLDEGIERLRLAQPTSAGKKDQRKANRVN